MTTFFMSVSAVWYACPISSGTKKNVSRALKKYFTYNKVFGQTEPEHSNAIVGALTSSSPIVSFSTTVKLRYAYFVTKDLKNNIYWYFK